MRSISISVLPIVVLVFGCSESTSEQPQTDTVPPQLSAAEPVTPPSPPNSPSRTGEFLCDGELGVFGRFWEGETPRASLSLSSGEMLELPNVDSTSGISYTSLDGSAAWSEDGGASQLTFGGEEFSCTEAEPGQIEF